MRRELITGNNNIVIGHNGVGAESNTIRIGDPAIQTATYIAGISGATVPSSVTVIRSDSEWPPRDDECPRARFKNEIKPMEQGQ